MVIKNPDVFKDSYRYDADHRQCLYTGLYGDYVPNVLSGVIASIHGKSHAKELEVYREKTGETVLRAGMLHNHIQPNVIATHIYDLIKNCHYVHKDLPTKVDSLVTFETKEYRNFTVKTTSHSYPLGFMYTLHMYFSGKSKKEIIEKVGEDVYAVVIGTPYDPFTQEGYVALKEEAAELATCYANKINVQRSLESDEETKMNNEYSQKLMAIDRKFAELQDEKEAIEKERDLNRQKIREKHDDKVRAIREEYDERLAVIKQKMDQIGVKQQWDPSTKHSDREWRAVKNSDGTIGLLVYNTK